VIKLTQEVVLIKALILLLILLFSLTGTGCRQTTARNLPPENSNEPSIETPLPTENEIAPPGEETENAGPEEAENTVEDILHLHPNELGQVMILMYHEIGGEEGSWRRTVENFRSDLETLYLEGYRPVNLMDLLSGNINVPPGTTPFVLTFDDGTLGQFRYLEDEENKTVLDPDCAVAILLEMAEKYDDFSVAGTFYIYYPVPFRQQAYVEKKLKALVEWGFEIGNHAYNHENLAKISREEAIKALAKNVQSTLKYLPDYQVRSLALPYGARPREDDHLLAGIWEDITYKNEAILLVGANPAPSPYAKNFDPLRLPRVRADGQELPKWLEYFRQHPHLRYFSDGDPETITFPEEFADKLAETATGGKKIRLYNSDDY